MGHPPHLVQRKLSVRVLDLAIRMMAPLLVPLFWAGKKTFKLIFGPMAVRMSRESEEKLGHEIMSNLPFLFEDYKGRLCPDETIKHPRPFDYAVAIVALEHFSLRFIRGRGEFTVQIATKPAPASWEDLSIVLGLIDEGFGHRRHFSSFDEVSTALKPRMKLLQEAVSSDQGWPRFGL